MEHFTASLQNLFVTLDHLTDEVEERTRESALRWAREVLQGDPNQNLTFVLAIILNNSISDPMLAKPKWV